LNPPEKGNDVFTIEEPVPSRFPSAWSRYLAATRPPFLAASFVPCLLGLATAHADGVALNFGTALLSILGALTVHAGVNVLNDYYDARNGTDAANTDRIFPFTGGSRFIQNGVLTEAQMARLGYLLLGVTALVGLLLLPVAGWGLVGVGLAGMFLGWAYSAPPFSLNSRGLGEVSVAIGFGLLIVVGCDLVQRGSFALPPLWASLPYGLMVAALLYVNQFPDRRADNLAGKRHWVVRLGPDRGRWGYAVIVIGAYLALAVLVFASALPNTALLGLLTLPLSLKAAAEVLRYAATPGRLRAAIPLTIAAMVLHGLLLTLGLSLANP